jgi:hypothetical protein
LPGSEAIILTIPKEIKDWKGEADPAVNALLWAEDRPPKLMNRDASEHKDG